MLQTKFIFGNPNNLELDRTKFDSTNRFKLNTFYLMKSHGRSNKITGASSLVQFVSRIILQCTSKLLNEKNVYRDKLRMLLKALALVGSNNIQDSTITWNINDEFLVNTFNSRALENWTSNMRMRDVKELDLWMKIAKVGRYLMFSKNIEFEVKYIGDSDKFPQSAVNLATSIQPEYKDKDNLFNAKIAKSRHAVFGFPRLIDIDWTTRKLVYQAEQFDKKE